MHSTNNVNDGYLGSGKIIKSSIKKYGKQNHKIEILEFHDTREKLAIRESEIVNASLLQNPLCMNLKLGGENTGFLGGKHSTESRLLISESNRKRFECDVNRENISKSLVGRTISDETKQKMSEAKSNMTADTKTKMSESKKGKTTTWSCKATIILGVEYQSISEAARILKLNRSQIRKLVSLEFD